MALILTEAKEDYLDNSGVLLQDIYNSSGTLLARKGTHLKRNLKTRIYIHDLSPVETASDILEEKKNQLRKSKVKKNTINYYEKIYDSFRATILTDSVSRKNFANIDKVVGEICKSKVVKPAQLYQCVNLVRSKDNYTLHHSMSVMLMMYQAMLDIQTYSAYNAKLRAFFENIEFNGENVRTYLLGALLHDYGKIYIPMSILKNNDTLRDGEKKIIQLHPGRGVKALKQIGVRDPRILRLVGNHHCNYTYFKDGQRPLEMVINILDIYDACRSERSYSRSMSLEETLEALDINRRAGGWPEFLLDFLYRTTIYSCETFIDLSENK